MKEYHKIEKWKLAYFARILDGEGCVRIGKTKSQHNKYPYDYRGYVQIGMTSKVVLIWLSQNIGGSFYKCKNESVKCKISYNWFMNPKPATKILNQILPYLIEKKSHARIFIEYANTINGRPGLKGLHPEIVEKREVLYQQLKTLNRKGPINATLP